MRCLPSISAVSALGEEMKRWASLRRSVRSSLKRSVGEQSSWSLPKESNKPAPVRYFDRVEITYAIDM